MNFPEHDPLRFSSNVPTCLDCSNRTGICPSDSIGTHRHADAGYCPLNKLPVTGEKPDGWEELANEPLRPAAPAPEITPAEWGPPLWAEIHAWAASADLYRVAEYLDAFALRVPCGACREHWRAIVAANPPDVSSNAVLERWVSDRHDDVSRSLGKAPHP